MTFIEIEDASANHDEFVAQAHRTVKCSWCGEIIRLDGQELGLAMCPACYEQMLADFLRAQQLNQPSSHASDR